MTTTPLYCEATHETSPHGCFEPYHHTGPHRGWTEPNQYGDEDQFYWGNEAPEPVSPAFTQAEVGILLTALVPVETYFPELRKKLELMQANS